MFDVLGSTGTGEITPLIKDPTKARAETRIDGKVHCSQGGSDAFVTPLHEGGRRSFCPTISKSANLLEVGILRRGIIPNACKVKSHTRGVKGRRRTSWGKESGKNHKVARKRARRRQKKGVLNEGEGE